MRRHSILVLVAALGLLATPSWAAEPFGHFDGGLNGRNAATGVIGVTGWALDDDGVRAVDIYVDGRPVGRAGYGRHRARVAILFSEFPDADGAGFGFLLDTTHFFNGLHTVEALVISEAGERKFLNPIEIEFANSTHLLGPFGAIDFPLKQAELFGVCEDLTDPNRRYTVITGWVLDVGVEQGDQGGAPDQGDPPGDSGVGWVELLLDGSILRNTKLDCDHEVAKGGLSDCYGLPSPDVERIHPNAPDASHARFRFVLDIGSLVDFGFTRGSHVLTIRSGDIAGQVANVDEIAVTFRCVEDRGNDPSFGFIDGPRGGKIRSGIIKVTGWALDLEGVEKVEVFVDGFPVGEATHGIFRRGVSRMHPGFPDSRGAGFVLDFDTTEVSDGFHDVQVLITDERGDTTMIGERTFRVDNQKAP